MSAKHTPGPWIVEYDGEFVSGHVISTKHDYAGNTKSRRDSVTAPDSMTAADALLIAAAPDLLEALQTMLAQFTKTPSTLKDSDARCKAHAAITKATGGAA